MTITVIQPPLQTDQQIAGGVHQYLSIELVLMVMFIASWWIIPHGQLVTYVHQLEPLRQDSGYPGGLSGYGCAL